MAQSDAWVIGDQWAQMGTSSTTIPLVALPQPTQDGIHDNWKYSGEIGDQSSTARGDGAGGLLFFGINGNLYDGDGYMIADGENVPGCTECISTGFAGEFLTVPVPGQCALFYVIRAKRRVFPKLAFVVSLLDMSADNPRWPGRHGKLVNLAFNAPDDITYAQFNTWFATNWIEDYSALITDQGSEIKNLYGSVAVMDPHWANGEMLLHCTTSDRVRQWRITSSGFTNISTFWLIPGVGTFSKGMLRDTDFGIDQATGELLFAVTGCSMEANQAPPECAVIVSHLDASTGSLITQTGYNVTPIPPINCTDGDTPNGVFGCAFSPSGDKLFFTGNIDNVNLGAIDLATSAVTNLTNLSNLTIPDPGNRILTHLYRNLAPDGVTPAIYYAHANGLSALIGPDDLATATWIDQVSFSGTLNMVPLGSNPYSTSSATPYLLNAQIYQDPYPSIMASSACCIAREANGPEAAHGDVFNGTTTSANPWTPNANGLGIIGTSYIYFPQDFTVQAGARLYVQNMDWRFAPNARLIVEPGAYVRFDNCTLEASHCGPFRWPGIRIEGTTTASQFPLVNGSQGYVSMVNSTVVNAVTGVWCAKENGGIADPASYGGVIRVQGSTFKNCITGVRITDYNYNNAPEASTFYNTTFVMDTDRPDQTALNAHAYISNTRSVNFTDCRFSNLTPDPVLMNGTGIKVLNGQVRVTGSNYQNAYFHNLMAGVINSGGTLSPSTINHMDFRDNQYGIFDMSTGFSRYTNNQISVPGNGGSIYAAVGMYLWLPQQFTIERNIISGDGNGHNVGMYFLGINPALPYQDWVYTDSKIYDNTFNGLYAGCIVKSAHRGHTSSQADQGLSLLCSDFTDNIYDMALLKASIIKPDQGHTGSQLSGNRFLTTANCTNTWDWNLDPEWNHIPQFNGMHLNVFRNEDPLCDVQCDNWPDFADIEVLGSGPWTENGLTPTCGGGILDQAHTIPGDLTQYQLANSQLVSALNIYNGNLDAGEKPDLIEMLIKEEPPLPSSTLRDALLANSPLSDEVLVTMLKREPAMDPWHLTQVLVANVRLNPGVVGLAKEMLSPFYFGVVSDAQQGSGVTWKQLMEQEIEQRRREKAGALASLGYLYGTDTITEGAVDSLRMIIASDSDLSYTQIRTAMYINDQNWPAAEAELSGAGQKLNGWQTYTDLMNYGTNHNGQWSALDTSEVAVLDQEMREGGAGASMAGGILYCNGLTKYLPEVEFPGEGPQQRLISLSTNGERTRPALALYPNPASTEAYLKWPVEEKGSLIQVMDAQGRILLEHQAVENGLSRLDLTELPAGLYKVCLNGSGLSASFSIVR